MLAINKVASHFIYNAEINTTIKDVNEEIKINRALKALETADEYLVTEWLMIYIPKRLETLKTLAKFGKTVVLKQALWAIACEIDSQEWIKKLQFNAA